jgi:hypothetical protein
VKNASKKPYKFSHTPRSQKGLGDYYGTGIVQKLGRIRGNTVGMHSISQKGLKNKPKSLA